MIKNIIISICIGAALIVAAHFFIDFKWSRVGSLDIIIGSFLDFFLLNMMLFIYNQHQDQKLQQHLANHLDKIEQLLKKAYATIKEKEKE